jgi:hypothetical protein
MSIALTGKLLQILTQQSGTGKNGPWVKQDFILETEGEFPRKVCISAWGDKAKEVAEFREGEELEVHVNIESREFNSRWYTDVKAWKFERTTPGESIVPPPAFKDEDIPLIQEDDLPF